TATSSPSVAARPQANHAVAPRWATFGTVTDHLTRPLETERHRAPLVSAVCSVVALTHTRRTRTIATWVHAPQDERPRSVGFVNAPVRELVQSFAGSICL